MLNMLMIIRIDFRLFFKENSGLPSDVDSTQVAFNSVYQWAELRPFSSSNKDEDGMGNYVHSRFSLPNKPALLNSRCVM